MCGACGVLGGGPDWIDRAGNPDGIGNAAGVTAGAERQRRIRLVNLVLQGSGSKVIDVGSATVVRGPTGRHEVVRDLMHVWAAADRVGPRPVDPLSPAFLVRLDA
jgi:hypothetical protein